MKLKCSSEQAETDDGPTLAYHRFSNNSLSMAKQPQQEKAATTLHKRKAQDAPLQGASCAFSLIPTSFLPDRYIGCKRHNVFFGIFDFIQGDTVFALRFFQAHIRTEAKVFA